jgi:hypothetical protein
VTRTAERETAALAMLTAHNPVPDGAHSGPLAAEAVALLEQILATEPAREGRDPATRRRVLVGVGTVAAAAVAVVASGVLPSGSGPAGPSPAAAAVLRQAAAGAGNAPPLAPGSYVLTRSTAHELQIVSCLLPAECDKGRLRPGATAHAYSLDRVVQTWVDGQGAGRYRSVTGAPQISAELVDYFKQAQQPVPTTPPVLDEAINAAPGVYAGDPRGWPTEPKALAAAIVQRYEGGGSDAYATCDFATQLLQTTTDPALRAALYTVLAATPGITTAGVQQDRDGRSGQSFSITRDGVQSSWLVDAATGGLLQRTTTLTDPHADPAPAYKSLAAGTQLSVETFGTPEVVGSTQSP